MICKSEKKRQFFLLSHAFWLSKKRQAGKIVVAHDKPCRRSLTTALTLKKKKGRFPFSTRKNPDNKTEKYRVLFALPWEITVMTSKVKERGHEKGLSATF